MRISFIFPACFFLLSCWLGGIALNSSHIAAQKAQRESPYAVIMHEAVEGLRSYGVFVDYPDALPTLILCSPCLNKHEAFGAYQLSSNEVVVPDNFDITTLEGHGILIHEYGHYLMTKNGIPDEKQENLCLMLGNSVYRKYFALAANP